MIWNKLGCKLTAKNYINRLNVHQLRSQAQDRGLIFAAPGHLMLSRRLEAFLITPGLGAHLNNISIAGERQSRIGSSLKALSRRLSFAYNVMATTDGHAQGSGHSALWPLGWTPYSIIRGHTW